MPVFWKENRKPLLFIHVPKAGGSSFSSALEGHGWRELYSIRGIHAQALDFTHCSPQHWHGEILELLFKPQLFERIVVILRDPFERFMSEYRWQCIQGMTSMPPAEWTSFALESYGQDPYAFDNHIRPQSDFVIAGASLFHLERCGLAAAVEFCLGCLSQASSDCLVEPASLVLPHLKRTDDQPRLRDQFEPLRASIMDFYQSDYRLLASLGG